MRACRRLALCAVALQPAIKRVSKDLGRLIIGGSMLLRREARQPMGRVFSSAVRKVADCAIIPVVDSLLRAGSTEMLRYSNPLRYTDPTVFKTY